MRHGGQRSRRFMRREEMRRAHRLLVALGRQAERQRRKEREVDEEQADVITVCTSWLDALGYDEESRGKLQERVNEKNRRRGDF